MDTFDSIHPCPGYNEVRDANLLLPDKNILCFQKCHAEAASMNIAEGHDNCGQSNYSIFFTPHKPTNFTLLIN